MSNSQIQSKTKNRVYLALKTYFSGPDDAVDVSDGPGDSIHVVIVSRKFDGQGLKERNDLIWARLMEKLTSEEWGKVSLSVTASPEDVKAVPV
jgi:acid stress-induced BolA-like protein IbaG/YrbA